MLIFGCSVLYGGLAICITIAVRRRDRPEGNRPPALTQPNPDAKQ